MSVRDFFYRASDLYCYGLRLHGKRVAGYTDFWFRDQSDREEFASHWRALGWRLELISE